MARPLLHPRFATAFGNAMTDTLTVWRNPAAEGGLVGPPELAATIAQIGIMPISAKTGRLIPEPLLAGGRVSHVGITATTPDAQIGDELRDASGTIYKVEWRGLWLGAVCVLALSRPQGY